MPPSNTGRRSLAVAGAALLAGTLAACGVSGEGSARWEDGGQVPYGLLDSTTTTAGRPRLAPGPTIDVCLVLDGGEQLTAVERAAPRRATPADAVDSLAAGPTEDEAALGLSSALPEDAFGSAQTSSGGVVTVDLAPGFADVDGARQLLGVAQVVCTLTALPGVGQVAFTLGGDHVEVPRGDGAATSAPVARDDYAQLLPR